MAKTISISGQLEAVTTEGILADSQQIKYKESDVKTTIDNLNSRIDEISAGGSGVQEITNEEIDNLFKV